MVFMYLCLANSQAQVHTFVHTYQDWGSLDITEDKKNGYLFANGLNSVRIDRYGNKLWTQQLACDMLRQTDEDSNCFFQFGSATEMGGFYFNKIDYQGNVLEENFIATLVKNDSQITPRDVIYDVKRDQFIVCGIKNRYLARNCQFWIAGFDKHGKIVWQNTWSDPVQKSAYFKRILPNKATGGFLLLGNSFDDDDYSEIFTTDSMGRLKSRYFVDSCYHAAGLINRIEVFDIKTYRDSLFLLSSYRTYCNSEIAYYVLNKHGKAIRKIVTPNVSPMFLPLKNGNVLGAGGAGLIMLDTNFNIIWIREKIFGEHTDYGYEMRKIYQSQDGGFYGIVDGLKYHIPDNETSLVFVFKTDSLGNIYNREKYSEWDQSMMLIPNPASKNVRIAIPYYYGRIEAKFYDIQGKFIFKQTRNDTDPFDISALQSGLYMVEAINLETQASRKMKLVVD
jgi:hypothetical protein